MFWVSTLQVGSICWCLEGSPGDLVSVWRDARPGRRRAASPPPGAGCRMAAGGSWGRWCWWLTGWCVEAPCADNTFPNKNNKKIWQEPDSLEEVKQTSVCLLPACMLWMEGSRAYSRSGRSSSGSAAPLWSSSSLPDRAVFPFLWGCQRTASWRDFWLK